MTQVLLCVSVLIISGLILMFVLSSGSCPGCGGGHGDLCDPGALAGGVLVLSGFCNYIKKESFKLVV